MSKTVSQKPRVSILVPIYNVERYLDQCLQSLVNQTLKDIEIICLNDGSTDKSLEIIQKYAKDDPRIVIIDKPNSGYGDSMNQGLKRATGEYIGIVESDDWIELDAFEKMYLLASANDVDIVKAGYYFNKNGKDRNSLFINPADAGRVIDPLRHTWLFVIPPAIWSGIYRREFLEQNQINFLPTPGASYQDTSFSFKAWATAKRAYVTNEPFLHYRIDNESSSVNNPGKVFNVCYEYEEIAKYLRKHGLYDELAPLMQLTKFYTYMWNIFRLKTNLLPEFLKRVKAEYAQARADGLLFKSYFTEKRLWKTMNYIIDHPIWMSMIYVCGQRLHKKLADLNWMIQNKIRPYRRKQEQIAELITELYCDIDTLESKLKLIEEGKEL